MLQCIGMGFHQSGGEKTLTPEVGRVYRLVLREDSKVFALLMVLLEYSRQGSNESREELAVRQSSPKSWTVAFIPTPETFAPLPTRSEVVVNTQIQWGLPPSLQQLETRTVPILSLAEVGTTVSADHLLQMATAPRT